MSDIKLPTSVATVQWQEEKPAQDGNQRQQDLPADKVAETYEESHRTVTDKISILGIPIDLMTTQVQATIAGLVSEVDFLNAKVKRYEKSVPQGEVDPNAQILFGDHFTRSLDKALNVPPPAGHIREFALVVVNTYEDIRTSSGLLSANSTLVDVASRIVSAGLGAAPVGLVGGPTVAALLTRPEIMLNHGEHGETPLNTADMIRESVEQEAYSVAGLDMALRFTVASLRVETGQSALHAIGQADHILRS